ncbi:MAG: DegT/DnrJ/EryC1/StrS family aminotransferase [candidate division WOR-3 bacterium]
MKVPLLDLKRRYNLIKEEIDKSIEGVLNSQHFILGEEVTKLETAIAKYCGTKHAVAVASGTDALLLSLRSLDIGKGDFVITTPFTFFATAGAIHNVGAIPLFVDINPDTFNINPERVKVLLEGKTFHTKRLEIDLSRIKVIIPVHLYGQMADMDSLIGIADQYDLEIIEDACQAIGAEYKGKKAGSLGISGCFSFFPTKNLGGYGDGGIITTNRDEIASELRKLRVHGSEKDYHHLSVGYNSRLDTIQAAILLAEFPYLDDWNKKRQENAAIYSDSLKGIENLDCPFVAPDRKHIFHQYTIRVKNNKRDKLVDFLTQKGIGSKIYYPLPLHLQECFRYLGYKKGDFPYSEKAAEEVLSLPVFPELKQKEIKYVAESIKSFLGN